MANLRLISTDLDGTLLGGAHFDAIPAEVIHRIAEIKASGDVLWVINTGRHLRSLLEGPFRNTMFRVRPDYLVVEESRIYRRVGSHRYRPLRRWNRDVRRVQRSVLRELRPLIRVWKEEILREYDCESRARGAGHLWFRCDTDTAVRIERDLAEKIRGCPEALVYRNGTDVYLGFSLFTKGSALAEICMIEERTREETFAVGDGPNDLSMLDGSVAAWCAAVANADPEVIKQVRRIHGYVAEAPFADGVIESLEWALAAPEAEPAPSPFGRRHGSGTAGSSPQDP